MASDWLPRFVTQIDFGKGGKIQAPAYGVSGKGPSLCLNDFLGVLTKPALSKSARPITSLLQNMCHFHD